MTLTPERKRILREIAEEAQEQGGYIAPDLMIEAVDGLDAAEAQNVTTSVKCQDCNNGVRNIYAVQGLCVDCAESQMEGLQARIKELEHRLDEQVSQHEAGEARYEALQGLLKDAEARIENLGIDFTHDLGAELTVAQARTERLEGALEHFARFPLEEFLAANNGEGMYGFSCYRDDEPYDWVLRADNIRDARAALHDSPSSEAAILRASPEPYLPHLPHSTAPPVGVLGQDKGRVDSGVGPSTAGDHPVGPDREGWHNIHGQRTNMQGDVLSDEAPS